MKLGFVGLGKMGMNMVKRLVAGGHEVFCTARTTSRKSEAEAAGALWAEELASFRKGLSSPRVVWVMVPAGEQTYNTLGSLLDILEPGDIAIDGGNSDSRDTVRMAERFFQRGIGFVDVGTSGGIWGLEKGYCLMVGGSEKDISGLAPVLSTLAPPGGWERMGGPGSGHFVKMVHNAVEYGMMQAYAEGFHLLRESGMNLDLEKVSHLWNQGSVVRSWLLELAETIFRKDPRLESLRGTVADSGECRWTLEEGIRRGIPLPVFAAALFERFSSRQENAFPNRFLASLRNAFGGHPVEKPR